jgi:hypothetical protein
MFIVPALPDPKEQGRCHSERVVSKGFDGGREVGGSTAMERRSVARRFAPAKQLEARQGRE